VTDLAASIVRKARESAQVKEQFFIENAAKIVDACRVMARAFDRGARLFAMGNGGSACDAVHLALEHMHPVVERRPALPAIALGAGAPLLTAIGNDQDFSLAFARELRMLAVRGDIAVALSTSGQSQGVLRALQAAREIGMLTIGLTGRDGGRMPALCEHCFVVPSFSIHRIQETHETLLHVLWDTVHVIRGEEDTVG
jgi:D-sedoheptulose 7-phosphate isomerase